MNNIKKGLVILSLALFCVAGFATVKPIPKVPAPVGSVQAKAPTPAAPAPAPHKQPCATCRH